MQFRTLGHSGLRVSAVSYGNWLTHGSQVEEDAAVACVQRALELGITTFDTADAYAATRAESVLGRALAGVKRYEYELATKVYWRTAQGPNGSGLSRKHIMESIDRSLKRLSTDYVDVYQAHRYDYSTPLEETMLAFADVVRSGRALYIGVSEWNAQQISAAASLAKELRVPFISNQPQYSMLWRVIEAEVVPASIEHGLGQIVWSPLAQGVLTGKYQPGSPPPEGSRATDETGGKNMISRWMRDDVLEAVQKLMPIAQSAGMSMAQMAVAWVLCNPNVASAIVGATRPEQLDDTVAGVDKTLDATTLAAIDDVLGGLVERDPARTISPEDRP
jgi:aryl-alcohol dehydrogenase-like predicted oxidoreductase